MMIQVSDRSILTGCKPVFPCSPAGKDGSITIWFNPRIWFNQGVDQIGGQSSRLRTSASLQSCDASLGAIGLHCCGSALDNHRLS
jgi:hypothetical protein